MRYIIHKPTYQVYYIPTYQVYYIPIVILLIENRFLDYDIANPYFDLFNILGTSYPASCFQRSEWAHNYE